MRPRTRTAARTPYARFGPATQDAAGAERERPSRLSVSGRRIAGRQLDPVAERGLDDGEPVAATTRRAREIHDQRASTQAGYPAREERVWSSLERIGTDCLGDARRLALEHGSGRLRRNIPWCKSRSSRFQLEQ